MTTTTRNVVSLGALIALATMFTAACSTDGPAPTENAGPAAGSVTITNGWAKAAEDGMSAVFGELTNSTSSDVIISSATTDAADMIELHETVENESGDMVMREIEGGFVIPASDTLALEPGADHIMLMGLTQPITAGEEVSITLTFSDDSTLEFSAPVKDYAGANESYADIDHDMDHSDHEDTDSGEK